jgi:hypothetical protein
MSTEHTPDVSPAFDPFELLTAILLGLAAVGAAVSGLQGGQWGGKQLEAFADSNKMTTKAATEYNEASVLINADYAAIAAAKEHILEARDAGDGGSKKRYFDLASYYYTSQLTEEGYKALELPAGFYVEDPPEGHAGPAPPQAAPAAPAPTTQRPPSEEDEGEEETGATGPALERDIPDAELLETLTLELDEEYNHAKLASATKGFADAEKRFNEGKVANENGDQFDLAGVFFTVALFFAGVGLVFKTSIRWVFFGLGLLVFLGSAIFILTLPWAA